MPKGRFAPLDPPTFATWQAVRGRAPLTTSPERGVVPGRQGRSRFAVAARTLTPFHSNPCCFRKPRLNRLIRVGDHGCQGCKHTPKNASSTKENGKNPRGANSRGQEKCAWKGFCHIGRDNQIGIDPTQEIDHATNHESSEMVGAAIA